MFCFAVVVESTGADSPSQNGQVEKFNDILVVTNKLLLYSAGLHAKFWSAALMHAVYLHNCRCHKTIMHTPYEAWCGIKPNLKHLKLFGSRVSIKRTGKRRAKLDRHAFRGLVFQVTQQPMPTSDILTWTLVSLNGLITPSLMRLGTPPLPVHLLHSCSMTLVLLKIHLPRQVHQMSLCTDCISTATITHYRPFQIKAPS